MPVCMCVCVLQRSERTEEELIQAWIGLALESMGGRQLKSPHRQWSASLVVPSDLLVVVFATGTWASGAQGSESASGHGGMTSRTPPLLCDHLHGRAPHGPTFSR